MSKKKNIFSILLVVISVVCYVVGLVLSLTGYNSDNRTLNLTGAGILWGTGFIEVVIGLIYYVVFRHREKYTCPACGAKRVKHSVYLETTEESSVDKNYRMTKYTYHYLDSYVCPDCGETLEEQVTESGGTYYQGLNGNNIDKTRPPHKDY